MNQDFIQSKSHFCIKKLINNTLSKEYHIAYQLLYHIYNRNINLKS